jgi:predicted amidophosphoribosyltransferase
VIVHALNSYIRVLIRCATRGSMLVMSVFGHWSSTLTALAVPPRCIACGRGTLPDLRVCDCCKAAVERLPRGLIAPALRARFSASFAAFPYEGPVREIVQALKFRGAVAAAREMAALMVERVPVGLLEDSVIIPVPAHPSRRRSRGFNQAALLAREIAAICELEVWDCLARDHTQAPQSTLSRDDRLALSPDSIRVAQIKPHSKKRTTIGNSLANLPTKVVLLDDVTTTGVTLDICASAIRERYPVGYSNHPSHRMALHQVQIGVLTFASTSAHPAHTQELNSVGNLK